MGHSHDLTPPDGPSPITRRVRIVLISVTVVLALATVAGLVALWPRGESSMGTLNDTASEEVRFLDGTVRQVREDDEEVTAYVPNMGETTDVQVPPEVFVGGISVGDDIRLLYVPDAAASGSPYVFVDFKREMPLLLLAVVYALLVLAVARWRGLAAIGGLVLSIAVIGAFMLPALLEGKPPIAVAVVGSAAVMFVVLYLAHGISARTTSALLGTFAGLAVTVGLAAWSVGAAHLTGFTSDDAYTLYTYAPQMKLHGVLLCGMILAGLGVLNDVTITQASAVWELKSADPTMKMRQVFSKAMRIGRDHIASTVYTIVFAYAGAALPLFLLVSLYDRAFLDWITAGEIAEEVVRTLVSSIGLVLAIPMTTAVAAWVVSVGDRPQEKKVPQVTAT